MTPPPGPNPRRLPRRTLLQGAAAGAIAAVLGPTNGLTPAQASGVLPGAALTELRTYTGWRRSWDLVVPLSTDRAFPRRFILYDRAAGQGTLLAVDAAGNASELTTYSGWRKSWDTIIASGFPRILGVSGLVFYDKSAGEIATMQIDQFGNATQTRLVSNLRKSWTLFAPVGSGGLLMYDRTAGFGSLASIDTVGNLKDIRSYNSWRTTWDIITMGPYTSGALPSGDLLFYDRAARQAEGNTFQGTGDVTRFASYSGWRSTWTSLHGGLFLFQGFSASDTANVVCFDRDARQVEFIDIGPGNALTSVLLTATPGTNTWTSVTPLGPNLLLFYDRVNGVGGFYTTTKAQVAPPTPTPLPPTPTPVVAQSGEVNVRLQQGRGNFWHTYTAKSDNPKVGGGLTARITGVTNTGDKRIAIIFRDKNGKRTGPVFLKGGESSNAFNGMTVGGDWEGRITGSRAEAPARVPLVVSYEAG